MNAQVPEELRAWEDRYWITQTKEGGWAAVIPRAHMGKEPLVIRRASPKELAEELCDLRGMSVA